MQILSDYAIYFSAQKGRLWYTGCRKQNTEGSIVEEHRFLISETAKIVAVEPHVLRYWEEELEIPVGRTELGHRYYTRENIETFQKVKKLKEEGLQLKAIRLVLKGAAHPGRQNGGQQASGQTDGWRETEEQTGSRQNGWQTTDSQQGGWRGTNGQSDNWRDAEDQAVKRQSGGQQTNGQTDDWRDAEDQAKRESAQDEDVSLAVLRSNAQKLQQFMDLVEGIVEKVVKDNNVELQKRLEESMARETDYLLHIQEKREEEHFRLLDEAIRERQKNSRFVAASREKRSFWDKLLRR